MYVEIKKKKVKNIYIAHTVGSLNTSHHYHTQDVYPLVLSFMYLENISHIKTPKGCNLLTS